MPLQRASLRAGTNAPGRLDGEAVGTPRANRACGAVPEVPPFRRMALAILPTTSGCTGSRVVPIP